MYIIYIYVYHIYHIYIYISYIYIYHIYIYLYIYHLITIHRWQSRIIYSLMSTKTRNFQGLCPSLKTGNSPARWRTLDASHSHGQSNWDFLESDPMAWESVGKSQCSTADLLSLPWFTMVYYEISPIKNMKMALLVRLFVGNWSCHL